MIERYLIYGLVVVLFLGAAWGKGYLAGSKRLEDHIAAQAKEEVRVNNERVKVTERVLTRYVKVKGDTQVITETIEKEVIKYAEANTGHCLDADWGRLHDRAALNLPATAGLPDGERRAPEAANALKTVTESYAACHRTADRLDSLQDWIRQQAGVR